MTEARQSKIAIEGRSCTSCVGRLEAAPAAVPGVLDVTVNLATRSATVRLAEGATGPGALMVATRAAGYPAELAGADRTGDAAARQTAETRQTARRAALAAAAIALSSVVVLANALRLRPVMDEGTTAGTPGGAARPGVTPTEREARA